MNLEKLPKINNTTAKTAHILRRMSDYSFHE